MNDTRVAKKSITDNLVELGKRNYAQSFIDRQSERRVVLRRPDTSAFFAELILGSSGTLIILGDGPDLMLRSYSFASVRDAISWVAGSELGYLESKVVAGERSRFDAELAKSELREFVEESEGEQEEPGRKPHPYRDVLEDFCWDEASPHSLAAALYDADDEGICEYTFGMHASTDLVNTREACRRVLALIKAAEPDTLGFGMGKQRDAAELGRTSQSDDGAQATPRVLACHDCGVTGVQLWRPYQDVEPLRCQACGEKSQGKARDGHRIKWLVPAVPDNHDSFWGFSSVPAERVAWWESLPAMSADHDITGMLLRLRKVVAELRASKGRDAVRALPHGKVLDYLDATSSKPDADPFQPPGAACDRVSWVATTPDESVAERIVSKVTDKQVTFLFIRCIARMSTGMSCAEIRSLVETLLGEVDRFRKPRLVEPAGVGCDAEPAGEEVPR